MFKARTTHGRLKIISCPQWNKKFCLEMHILQYMNQLMDLCYTATWLEDQQSSLHQVHYEPSSGHSSSHDTLDPHWKPNLQRDLDVNYHVPLSSQPYNEPVDLRMDIDHNLNAQASQMFTKTFDGYSEAFPGGSTFMDKFWQDKYAKKWQENLYFPFTSHDEWQFTSWCIHSELSISIMNVLLSLNTISDIVNCISVPSHVSKIKGLLLSFQTVKELQACMETFPSSPQWLCNV